MPEAQRTPALKPVISGSPVATLTPAANATRISLRADEQSAMALSAALGVNLPTAPLQSNANGARIALWLGPDEWLVIDEDGADVMALAGSVNALHSAVDVSHRNTAIIVKGPSAADAINTACPLDLSLAAFPVGKCARTVLGKIEIVLWRKTEDEFRVECWRSFAPFALGMLNEGASDAAV